MFDEARLLSPGTLIEEAALRRTVGLAPHGLDGPRFLMAAGQYVRRFLRSPYASQFVDALVAGIVALNQTVDLDELDNIVAGMDAEQQKVVYLRLARRAGIDGIPGLAEYASGKAEAIKVDGADPSSDPRALLYSSLATITSDNVDKVLPQLQAIDRSRLSASDRKLLDAAEAIAAEVTARPQGAPVAPAQPADAGPGGSATDRAEAGSQDGLPEAEPLTAPQATTSPASDLSPPASAASAEPSTAVAPPAAATQAAKSLPGAKPAAATDRPPAAQPAVAAPTNDTAAAGPPDGAAPVDADQTSAIVDDARKKLDEIDKLLKDSAQ
jgi:chemotaxis protein MotC